MSCVVVMRTTHAAKIGGDGFNAVRLFHPQFGGIAHNQAVLAESAEDREHWDFINQRRGGGAFDGPAFDDGTFDLQIADEFAVDLFDVKKLEYRRPCSAEHRATRCALGSSRRW